MIRTLNHATLRGVGPEAAADAAARAGYRGIGLWATDLPADPAALADLRARLALPVTEIDVAARFATPQEARAGLPALRDAAAKAAALGCGIVVTGAPVGAVDDGTAAAVRAAAEAVAEHGPRLALEPLCQAAELCSPARLAALLEAAGDPGAAIALDTFHAAVAGATPAEVAAAAERIALVHVADAPDLPRATLLEPHRHRVLPGHGVQPVDAYLDALARAGWDGPLAVDVFDEALWARDADEVARASFAALAALPALAAAGRR